MSKHTLWVEKYRPQTLADYVWSSDDQRAQVESWLSDGVLPQIMLTGPAGTGKTSLALMLLKLLKVDNSDIRMINGCTTNGVDEVRSIENFISTMAMGDYRYVLIDEFDFFSAAGQAALKNMMETYSGMARFIFTANLAHKIIPPIKSRCQTFEIQTLDRSLYMERIATILMREGVDLNEENLEVLEDYVNVAYPDLRKCINMLQQNCINGVLNRPSGMSSSGTADYVVQAVGMFREGKITEARKMLSPKLNANEFEEVYKLLYQNLQWWGKDDAKQSQAIITIANRMRDHSICADPEINFSACLCELEMVRNG